MGDWDSRTKLEEQTISFFMRGMKVIWELLGKEKKLIIIILVLTAFLQFAGLLLNVLLKYLFDELPNLTNSGHFSKCVIAILALIFLVKIIALIVRRFFVEIKFLKSLIRLENAWPALAHKRLLSLSLGYHERENTGKKIDKINKGCERLVDISCRLYWGFVPQFFYLIINMIIIMVIDWRLGLMFIAPFPFAIYFYLRAFRRAAPAFEAWEANKEEATGLFCQSIINIQTVQNYVQEKREEYGFSKIRKNMEKLDIEASVSMQYYFFAAITILWIFFVGTIAMGIYFVVNGIGTVGTVVYIIATGTVTFEGLWHLVHEYTEILRRLISVFRMKELLDEKPEIMSSPNAVTPKQYIGKIKLDNLSFVYPNKKQEVLSGINMEIERGEMIALVGKSGEGKTTAVRLISRMFDVTKGKIMLDGQNIRNISLEWYRRLFAVVQQDVDIFDASILDNIRYAYPRASEDQVKKAIKAAYLGVVLKDKNRFPSGLHEKVGERGVRLSGGERQRVGIARAFLALLNGAKVLILDEATSNLDSQAERAIQKMILDLRKKESITIIAIAHRLSTIQKADTIYVINNGRIAEQGSHSHLVEEKGIYAELVNLQRLGELRE
jgi:ABC-type multidrug transport system fused ATPase/permease subunit